MNAPEKAEQIARKIVADNGCGVGCTCEHIYKGRGRIDPDCRWCEIGEELVKDITSALEVPEGHVGKLAAAEWARQNIRSFWSFSNTQQHTHNWHSREDFVEEWDRRAEGKDENENS